MKRTIIILATLLLPLLGKAQGNVSYSMPQTVLVFNIEAQREQFYAGPYAQYAQKYLGVKAELEDHVSYSVTSVKMVPAVEADQSQRYSYVMNQQSHPVFLSSEGGLSIDMEKVLAQQANPDNRIKAMKVLEINAGHPIFEKMKNLYAEGDKDKVTLYSKLLFGQALLMEGLNVDDPVAFANDICELM